MMRRCSDQYRVALQINGPSHFFRLWFEIGHRKPHEHGMEPSFAKGSWEPWAKFEPEKSCSVRRRRKPCDRRSRARRRSPSALLVAGLLAAGKERASCIQSKGKKWRFLLPSQLVQVNAMSCTSSIVMGACQSHPLRRQACA